MSTLKKIAVLASGGDSQGMNTCIKTIVNICTVNNIEVVAFNRGYQGLIENDITRLDNLMVENIGQLGGCFIKVARSKEFLTQKGIDKAMANIRANNIDGVIIIGGNGSLTGAYEFVKNNIPVIGVPGTIDNDLYYTDKTLGFDTAVNNAVNAIDNIRQTMLANNRGLVVKVMGRDCGDIALNVAVACNAHSLSVKEVPKTIDEIVDDLKFCMSKGVESPLVILNEYVDYSLEDIEDAIHKKLNIETRNTTLGYIQRGGAPSVEDRKLATQFGITAVELLKQGKSGLAVGVKDSKIISVGLREAVEAKEQFDYNLYNQLRDLHGLSRDK